MAAKSRTHNSILNIVTGLGGYVINTVLGFLCRIVFIRCLSAEYLGISGLFANILTMLSLAELGIGSAIVFALYKPLAENDESKIASLMRYYAKAWYCCSNIWFMYDSFFRICYKRSTTYKRKFICNIFDLFI